VANKLIQGLMLKYIIYYVFLWIIEGAHIILLRIDPFDEMTVPMPIRYNTLYSLQYTPEDIDSTLCTHVVYSFAKVENGTGKCVPGNRTMDVDQGKIFGYASVYVRASWKIGT